MMWGWGGWGGGGAVKLVLRFSYISAVNATIEPIHQNPSGATPPGRVQQDFL